MRRIVSLALLFTLALPLLSGCQWYRRRMQRPRPPYAKVFPPIAYEIIRDSPSILILDLRPGKDFNGNTGHIFRAHNIPLDRLPFRLLEISPFRDETFLVYCDTRPCAEEGMAVLKSSGFENAILIDGGIDAWIERGYGTVLPSDITGRAAESAAASKEMQRGTSSPLPGAAATAPPAGPSAPQPPAPPPSSPPPPPPKPPL